MFSFARLGLFLLLLVATPVIAAEDAVVPAGNPADSSAAAPVSPVDLRRQARAAWNRRKKSPLPWLLMGRACEAEGRKGKALKYFAKALKRDPLAAEAYFHRGRLFESKGLLDEAANEYQAALKADGDFAEAKDAWAALSKRLEEPVKN